jgi:hypothetical protein
MRPATTKQEAVDRIAARLGVRSLPVSNGSTEPKQIFVDAVDVLGLPIDTTRDKPFLGREIARRARISWDFSCDSTESPSEGGDTVTLEGLNRVLRAVHILADRAGL